MLTFWSIRTTTTPTTPLSFSVLTPWRVIVALRCRASGAIGTSTTFRKAVNIEKIGGLLMSFSGPLKLLSLAGAILIASSVMVPSVRAQDETATPDAKPKKTTTFHAKGPVTLGTTTCPAGTAPSDQCYAISASLTQGSTSGNLTGTLITSSTPMQTAKGTCYTIINTSTETATEGTTSINITLSGEACIKTNKKGSVEKGGGPWTTVGGSTVTGGGKEAWVITPTAPTSPVSPLAGPGTMTFRGKVHQ
jgi:hypothetical protein